MSAIEFSGVEQTFTCLAGEAKVFDWVFTRDGERFDLGEVVFSGVVVLPDGSTLDVLVEHLSEETGAVRVSFPVLEAGTYDYEVRYSAGSGDLGRVVFGRIGVVSSALVLETLEDAERDRQTLLLKLPEKAGGHVQLEWLASSASLAAAAKAIEAAKKLEGVDATLGRLEAQVEEFRVFVAKWHEDIRSVLVLNPVTGTIWIDGVDTGQPYRGEPGKAPRVNAYGNWERFEDGAWIDTGVRAFGKDGVDGDKVRRVLLNSEDELPERAERGVVYYTPKIGGGYNMWVWFEDVGWLNSGTDAYGYAELDYMGMVKLATDLPVVAGAPVGLNSRKQAMVPMASDSVPGAMMASSPEVSDVGGGTHFSQSGRLLSDVADVNGYGSVMLSTSALLVDENGNNFGGFVGRNGDGQLMVQVASAGRVGAVKPGSAYEQLLAPPFQVAVGVNREGALANCLLKGGALQHRTDSDWNARDNIFWLEDGAFPVAGAHYLGLNTTVQFRQSREVGLELLPATTEIVGGVRLAAGLDDDGDVAVVPAKMINGRFEDKGHGYSKAEADERFMSRAGGCVTVKVVKDGPVPPANEQEAGVLYIGLYSGR